MISQDYLNFLSNKLEEHIAHKKLQYILVELARSNNVEILYANKIRSSRGSDISNGVLVLPKLTKRNNVPFETLNRQIHELCHILVCEPKFRHMISGSTVTSYQNINDWKYSKYNSEAATLVLQHLLYKKFDIPTFFVAVNFGTSIISLALGSDLMSRTHWEEKYGDIMNIVNTDIAFTDIGAIKYYTETFDEDQLYYGLINKTKNRDYTLQQFKYSDNTFINTKTNRLVKPTAIGVLSTFQI